MKLHGEAKSDILNCYSISLTYHFFDVELLTDIFFLQTLVAGRCFGQIIEHGMNFFLNSKLGSNLLFPPIF